MLDVTGTFSIVAADAATGEVGCAVESKYFAIGAVTPWVRAGVGAVATQAMGVVARNGEQALYALTAGADPATALRRALAEDSDREIRQLGAVTADGRSAAFTGATAWNGRAISSETEPCGAGKHADECRRSHCYATRFRGNARVLPAVDGWRSKPHRLPAATGAASKLPRSSSSSWVGETIARRDRSDM